MKEITIKIPDNCELKQDGNTYTIVEKEKKLTYEDVVKKLFPIGGYHFYVTSDACIERAKNCESNYKLENNTTSEKQAEKLLAINKLMNVAKYLNGDWQPDWNNINEYKFFIYFSNELKKVNIDCVRSMQKLFIYFKSEKLAKQAIEILGEKTIRLALCTDY